MNKRPGSRNKSKIEKLKMMKKEKADIYSSAGTTAESDSTVKDISFSQPIAKPNVIGRLF